MTDNHEEHGNSNDGGRGRKRSGGAASASGAGKAWGYLRGRRWPWILLAVLVVLVVFPLALFAYAYAQYDVPEPEEVQSNQVATIFANDEHTQLARIVPPEGNRSHVELDQTPDSLENAVMAAEDREFWTNSGFSISGFGRAIIGQFTGNDSAGGGSTITQQYVKNTLVGNERSYVRKARELIYSIKMTHEWSKEDILNAYLNTVYFGRNAYGVQAASSAYFNKDVKDLTPEESALLAGLIQRPSELDPWNNRAESEARWNYVMDGLVEMGQITQDQRDNAKFPEVRDPAEYSAYTEAPGANGHIKNQVMAELAEVGITEDEVNTRGLQITTTIDMNVQNASVDAVDKNLAPLQDDARAAAVTIDPKTGAVRGYFGGHEENGWDYANAPLQTGSTFKVMALAAALQQGIPLTAQYSSAPYQLPGSLVVQNYDEGVGCGVCSISEALKQSFNTSFMRLQDDLANRTQDTADMAHALGVAKSLPNIPQTLTENGETPYEGIVLGQYQSRAIDMATAIATLTNRGVWHDTYFVQKVTSSNGEVLYEHPTDGGERRVSSQVADNVIQAMKPVAAWSHGALAGGRESASKTGTAQLGDTGQNKDTWMIGSTPQLATAVWVGTADNTSAITNAWGGLMYGSGAPTQIWKSILDTSLENSDYESFPTATPVRYGTRSYGSGYSYNPNYSSDSGSSTSGTTGGTETAESTQQSASAAPAPAPAAPDTGGGTQPPANGGGTNPAPAAPGGQPAPQAPSLEDLLNPGGQLDGLFGR